MKLSDVSVARKSDLEAYYAENKEKINAAGIEIPEASKREAYVEALKKYLSGTVADKGAADIEVTPADEPTGAPRTQAEQAASDGAATGEAQHTAAEAPDNRTMGEQAASDGAETSEAEHRSAEVPDGRTQEEQATSDAAAPELKEAKDTMEKIDPDAAAQMPEPGAQPADETPDTGAKKKVISKASDVSEVEKQAAAAREADKKQLSADQSADIARVKKEQKDAKTAPGADAPAAPQESAPVAIKDMDSTELLRLLNARGFTTKEELASHLATLDRKEEHLRVSEREWLEKQEDLSKREVKIVKREQDFQVEAQKYQLERQNLNQEFEAFMIKKRKLMEFLKDF